jgi:hypothetical protein
MTVSESTPENAPLFGNCTDAGVVVNVIGGCVVTTPLFVFVFWKLGQAAKATVADASTRITDSATTKTRLRALNVL